MADLELYTGDSLTLNIVVTDSAGDDADLSDVQAAAYGLFNIEGTQFVTKRLGFGITIDAATVTITLLPADTLDLAPGQYVHELEVIDADAGVHTVYQGEIELKRGYIYTEEE